MSLFGALVKTVVNVVCLPVDTIKDVVNSPAILTEEEDSAVMKRLQQIKDDAEDSLDI
jgi:hypothetical protein